MTTAAAATIEESVLLRDDNNGVTTLTLNRPGQFNSLSQAMLSELLRALDEIAEDDAVRVVIIAANGRAFCAGHDLKEMRAMEMLLTGDFIDAATALDYGLVNRVVAEDRLDAAAWELARSICTKSPVAVSMGKQMFYRQLEMGLEEAYSFASNTMACNMASEDAREGIDAFIGKREPQWRGR